MLAKQVSANASAAQLDELLAETRRAHSTTKMLLAVMKRSARTAALRWGLENADLFKVKLSSSFVDDESKPLDSA